MSRIIGEGGLFEEDRLSDERPRTHGRKIAAALLGLNLVAGVGLFVACEYGDEQAAKTLAEQQRDFPLPGASGPQVSSSSRVPETVVSSSPVVSTAITPTRIPFSPVTQNSARSKAPSSAPPRTVSPSRPATTKASQQSSPAPKECRIVPKSGVATVTDLCGGDMLGYSTDSAPFPLSPGTQVAFNCQSNDGNGHIKVTVSNDFFYMSPNSLGNPC